MHVNWNLVEVQVLRTSQATNNKMAYASNFWMKQVASHQCENRFKSTLVNLCKYTMGVSLKTFGKENDYFQLVGCGDYSHIDFY